MMSSRTWIPRKVWGLGSLAVVAVAATWWLLRNPATPPSRGTAEEPATGAATPPALRGGSDPRAVDPVTGTDALRSSASEKPAKPAKPESLRDIVARNEGSNDTGAPGVSMPTPPSRDPGSGSVPSSGRTPGAAHTAPGQEGMRYREQPPATNSSPPPSAPANPAAPPASTPPTNPPSTSGPGGDGGRPLSAGLTSNADLARAIQLQATDPVQSRLLATRALDATTLTKAERDRGYELINSLAQQLFFRPDVNPNDTVMAVYTIASGDNLQKIVRNQKLSCDYRLLKRINALADERKLRPGQRLRVPKGVFHAEVVKGEYRLNLFLGEGSDRVMLASYRVGLGQSNGTPLGLFKVRPQSKLVDPEWTHPRTGEHYSSNDPRNPIGEHWIGLIGIEEKNKDFMGYGIHGTIEPDSIGQDRSLGCVRMLADDVAVVYECLTEPDSTILIR